MTWVFYDTVLVLSLLLLIAYVYRWRKHFDVHITLMFVLVPVANLGYAIFGHSSNLQEALAGYKLTFIGGCFALFLVMMIIFNLIGVKLPGPVKVACLLLSVIVFFSALSIGKAPLFYRSVSYDIVNGNPVLIREFGVMHTVFIVMMFVYFFVCLYAIGYAWFRKNQVSRKLLVLLYMPVLIGMIVFLFFRFRGGPELSPAVYDLALFNYLIIVHKLALYDITDTTIDSLVRNGDTGYASFDYSLNYLGSNETAKRIVPQFNNLTVDLPADRDETVRDTALKWIEAYRKNPSDNTVQYAAGDKIYQVVIRDLYDGTRNRGYHLEFTDDTRNQQYIRLMNRYNDDLKQEVSEKTAHIVEMHDNLILSMATMVESRDNSTGGHIRRTSEGVRILIDALRDDPAFKQDETFCRNLIKAAPMHDLGKIAVDDAILRKPGRFTPEEFEKMKVHPAEGARIVHEILKGTDDEAFRTIAENVAHYHHERWDGTGYPDGLKGEEIPLEARIMAIADVYDALVSKRVYKDQMSFAEADRIIAEGMGTQFDPNLAACYIKARPQLEAYYRSLGHGSD